MTDYRGLLHDIAVPRLAGTSADARVRARLAQELEHRGFRVREHRFTATSFRLGRVMAIGAGVLCGSLALAVTPFARDVSWIGQFLAPFFWGVVLWALVTALGLPAYVRTPHEAVNLEVVRGARDVRVWLVAHVDSKGQPFSMAGRLLGAGLAAVQVPLWGLFVGLGGLSQPAVWLDLLLLPGLLGGGVLALCGQAYADSPGALDNATGLLGVLTVLDALPPTAPVGVLLTDAEESGLEGARALARTRAELFQDAAVINFDGIDDRGRSIAFVHRAGPTVEAVTGSLGARRWRWLPVVVDGLELGKVARECVTIMRGDWQTMRVVHTRRDTVERLTLAGVGEVAEGVARALRERLGATS